MAAQNEQLKKHVARQKSENDQLKSEVLNRKEDNVTLLNLAWQAKYALEDERAARKAGLIHAKLKKIVVITQFV